MRQSKRAVVFALLVLCAAMVFAPAAFAGEKVIRIGALFPLTGPVAVSGQNCINSVMAVARTINEKNPDINVPFAAGEGVLGYKIEIVKADHQGKPDVAKSEAERLYNQEKVFAIIGCYNSSATKPASLVAERAKKLFLCGCSSSAALTERGYKYFFRHAATDTIESKEFLDHILYLNKEKNAGIKSIGVLYENTEFGKHAAEEAAKAAKAAGIPIVADVPFTPGATNLNSEVQTLKAANCDVVIGAALGGDYSLWVRTMKQLNWLPKASYNYCSGYQNPAVQKELLQDGDFFMGGMGYSPELALKFMPEAIKIEKKYYAPVSHQPFDSDSIQEAQMLLILAQAIEKAGAVDTEKVREVLATQEFRAEMALSGVAKFDETGQNVKVLTVITQLKDQQYGTVFPLKYKDTEPIFPITPWNER